MARLCLLRTAFTREGRGRSGQLEDKETDTWRPVSGQEGGRRGEGRSLLQLSMGYLAGLEAEASGNQLGRVEGGGYEREATSWILRRTVEATRGSSEGRREGGGGGTREGGSGRVREGGVEGEEGRVGGERGSGRERLRRSGSAQSAPDFLRRESLAATLERSTSTNSAPTEGVREGEEGEMEGEGRVAESGREGEGELGVEWEEDGDEVRERKNVSAFTLPRRWMPTEKWMLSEQEALKTSSMFDSEHLAGKIASIESKIQRLQAKRAKYLAQAALLERHKAKLAGPITWGAPAATWQPPARAHALQDR